MIIFIPRITPPLTQHTVTVRHMSVRLDLLEKDRVIWVGFGGVTVAGRSARRGDGQGGAGARRRALAARVWLTAARCELRAQGVATSS